MGNVLEMGVGSVSEGEVATLLRFAVINGHKTKGREGSQC